MTHTFNLRKDSRGNWKASTEITIGENEVKQARILSVSTFKTSDGAVVTTASVSHVEGMFMTHRMYGDFSERMISTRHGRVTEKVIREQQLAALKEIDEMIICAKAFYPEAVPA